MDVDKTPFSEGNGNRRLERRTEKKAVRVKETTKGMREDGIEAKLCPQAYCSFASDRTD